MKTQVGDFAHAIRPAGSEHFEADLGPADLPVQAAEDGCHVARGGGVEDKNQVAGHRPPLMRASGAQ